MLLLVCVTAKCSFTLQLVSKVEVKEHKLRSYPNPPLYLDGDCTDVATVGMAVAVSILVAFVTACVRVGPPRAELAACTETQKSFQRLDLVKWPDGSVRQRSLTSSRL